MGSGKMSSWPASRPSKIGLGDRRRRGLRNVQVARHVRVNRAGQDSVYAHAMLREQRALGLGE